MDNDVAQPGTILPQDETVSAFSGELIEDGDGWSVADEMRWQAEEARIDAYNDALDAQIKGFTS
jgi:hypothetical protein